jgi:predicted RNA-binding protein YlxR (DUF448 family)
MTFKTFKYQLKKPQKLISRGFYLLLNQSKIIQQEAEQYLARELHHW